MSDTRGSGEGGCEMLLVWWGSVTLLVHVWVCVCGGVTLLVWGGCGCVTLLVQGDASVGGSLCVSGLVWRGGECVQVLVKGDVCVCLSSLATTFCLRGSSKAFCHDPSGAGPWASASIKCHSKSKQWLLGEKRGVAVSWGSRAASWRDQPDSFGGRRPGQEWPPGRSIGLVPLNRAGGNRQW